MARPYRSQPPRSHSHWPALLLRRRPALAALAAAGGLALLASACGSGTSSPAAAANTAAATTSTTHPPQAGTADVAYAASMVNVNESVVGPGFQRSTGWTYRGRNGPSSGLSNEIAAGAITPGVFMSVGGTPITALEPKFTSWYVQLAASPIVVVYSPKSSFASSLAQVAAGKRPLSDLFTILQSPGFRLGRTDPETDPQGRYFIMMVELAQQTLGLPAGTVESLLGTGVTTGQPGNTAQIFAEASLASQVQAGQVDAGSAYLSQAVQYHLPYVALPAAINFGDPAQAASYATASLIVGGKKVTGSPAVVDVTTIATPGQTAVDTSAAAGFVAYVLSPAGRAIYAKAGYTLLPEKITGDSAAIPAAVTTAVQASAGAVPAAGSGGGSSG